MGSSFGPSKPNFAVFDNLIHEPSYLTGMVAGKATKSNLIGMVGGYAIPEVNRLMNAFMEGALSVNPNVKFWCTFINSWYDPPKAKEVAFAMIDKRRRRPLCRAFRRLGCRQGAQRQGDRQRDRYRRRSIRASSWRRALWHMEPTIDRAIKAVIGRRASSRPTTVRTATWPTAARASPLDEKLCPRTCRRGQGQGEGNPGRRLPRQHQRRGAEVDGMTGHLVVGKAVPHSGQGLRCAYIRTTCYDRHDPRASAALPPSCSRFRASPSASATLARQRRHRPRCRRGRDRGAARRERRRQDDADEHPLRPLRGR